VRKRCLLRNEKRITPEEYLERERGVEEKHEYFDGEIFAMSGLSFVHNQIVANPLSNLHAQLRGSPCQTITNDLRVQVEASGLYTYPDLVLVCGEPQFAGGHFDTLLNPVLLIVVLSPSTEAYERNAKFGHYRRLESLREYVLVSQDRPRVERYVRRDEGWDREETNGSDASVTLESVDCRLSLSEIYERVALPAPGA
jgi:Uma2 family endonuclease